MIPLKIKNFRAVFYETERIFYKKDFENLNFVSKYFFQMDYLGMIK